MEGANLACASARSRLFPIASARPARPAIYGFNRCSIGLAEQAFAGSQLGKPHVLQLLDDMGPVDRAIGLLARREPPQQGRLLLGPDEDVAVV